MASWPPSRSETAIAMSCTMLRRDSTSACSLMICCAFSCVAFGPVPARRLEDDLACCWICTRPPPPPPLPTLTSSTSTVFFRRSTSRLVLEDAARSSCISLSCALVFSASRSVAWRIFVRRSSPSIRGEAALHVASTATFTATTSATATPSAGLTSAFLLLGTLLVLTDCRSEGAAGSAALPLLRTLVLRDCTSAGGVGSIRSRSSTAVGSNSGGTGAAVSAAFTRVTATAFCHDGLPWPGGSRSR
mmetsp:Transcript_8021/g.30029  ORF Transcript_8021/g.30029 Transcript_8021/m.30029 type:complete len:246 (-) Transcript_8021:2386-3123(-)|eukprot:scaffold1006_cov270-Pinguiococcus_pyrenoidosus.AAC.19